MVVRSARTEQMYEVILKKIRDGIAPGSSGLLFLADTERVVGWIEGQPWALNTKKGVYIALKSLLRDAADPALAAAESAYNEKMVSYNAEYSKILAEQQLTDRERKLYVPWGRIRAADEKLRVGVKDWEEQQEYVIYCLYTKAAPVRLDYSPMAVAQDARDVGLTGNWLLAFGETWHFLFRDYKTAHKYGELKVAIAPVLRSVLSDWLELNDSGWLLLSPNGQPMTEKALGKAITRIFLRATGRALGVNMLRHSYITHKRRGEKSFKEQAEMAKAMGHSVGMSALYRRLDG